MSLSSEVKIVAGHTFPILKNLLETKGIALMGESSYFAAILIKTLKDKDVDEEILLELYEYLLTYCDVMGPLVAFSECETDFLLVHLCGHVQQMEKTNVQLHQSNVPKRGLKKRGRADLNVHADVAPQVNPAVHAAALKSIAAVLVSDPRSVSEQAFKSVAASVANEVIRVNAHRYTMSDTCVYAVARNRKLLYKLLSDVAQYPIHPLHRPLHIALRIFAEAAAWDVRDRELRIPTFCRKALLSLELITDPVISPYVYQREPEFSAYQTEAIHADADADEVVSEETVNDDVTASAEQTGDRQEETMPCFNTAKNQPSAAVEAETAAPATTSEAQTPEEMDDVLVMEVSDVTTKTMPASQGPGDMMETITIVDDDDDEENDGDKTVIANENLADDLIKPETRSSLQREEDHPQQPPEISCRKSRVSESPVQNGLAYSGSIFDVSPDVETNGMDHEEHVPLNETVDEILAYGDFQY